VNDRRPAIGGPLPGIRLRVLDSKGRQVPPGEPGELYLGGAGLAHGYPARPALTAVGFVPDDWAPGARMYRAGDLVRQLPDGKLDHLGRVEGPEPTAFSVAAPEDTVARPEPRDEYETVLVSLFRKVLGSDSIGTAGNFFVWGGHSLLAVQLLSEVETATGRRLPLAVLFEHSTPELLADALRNADKYRHRALVPIKRDGDAVRCSWCIPLAATSSPIRC